MKKIVYLVSVIVLIVIMNNLARSIYDLLKKQDILTSAQSELEAEKAENERLKKDLANASDPSFVEREARDKLFLVQSGETEVILPEIKSDEKKEEKPLPNYKKWIKIFGF